jgi:hypothetical protein
MTAGVHAIRPSAAQSTERIIPERFAKQHQDHRNPGDLGIEDPRDQQVVHADGHQEKQRGNRGDDPIQRIHHLVGSHLPGIGVVRANELEHRGIEQRVERRVVGVLKPEQGHRAVFGFRRLIVGDRADHFGG